MGSHSSLKHYALLIRAIAHKIRTPLSTIQNDLSYLASIFPPEEFVRGLEASRKIADVLKSAAVLPVNEVVEQVDFTEILRSRREITGAETLNCLKLNCDRRSVEFVVDGLSILIPELVVSRGNSEDSVKFEGLAPQNCQECSGTSLTELFAEKLQRDLVEPPLIDLILTSYGVVTSWSVRDGRITYVISGRV